MTRQLPKHVRVKTAKGRTYLYYELSTLNEAGKPILQKPAGGPWTPQSLRLHIQAWARAQGAEVVPHGLRKNAVNALLEAGCSSAETAAITGQTLGIVEFYAKRRDRGVLGSAAVLKWERKR